MQRRNHKVTTNAIILVVLLLVDRGGSAFQVPFRHVVPRQRPHAAFYLRSTTLLGVGKNAIRMPAENQISSDTTMIEGPHEHPPVVLAGKSPQAIRLRKALQEVWNSAKTSAPIILVGPPGSGKAELVDELLDRLPFWQKQVVHRLSMADAVNHHMDTMLGMKDHQQPGLLDLLADQTNATLVLTSFSSLMGSTCTSAEELERRQELYTTMAQLITDKTFYSRYDDKVKTFAPRIVVTCSQMPDFVNNNNKDRSNNSENDVFVVKVPALESRTQDMHAIASAKIKVLEKNYGLQNVKLSVEANHRLLDHKWDVDTAAYSELDQELGSALALLADEKKKDKASTTASNNNILQPRHMLVNAYNERMRHRLLYEYPALRKNVIASPWVFDHTLRYIVTPVFILTLLALFLGPQTRDHNTALTIFWAGWWPLVMLSFPLLGRIWCSICPFMAVGTLAQEAVTGTGSFAGISSRSGFVELQKWPKWGSTLGAPFAFGLFFAILMWEELWNLPQNGTLSAMLLLLITSGAVFNSVQYEKRFWCRYLCPIGAMCRVFGTMSMLEVRSWKANCEGCTDAQCLKGNSPAAKSSDEFAIKGCTIALKNNQLRDMGDCTLCMSCIKNCEREVPELNARPIGLDYGLPWLLPPALQNHPENLPLSQVDTNFWLGALLTTLQGSVFVHYMPQILSELGIDTAIATAPVALDMPFVAHAGVTAGLLALPGLLSLAVDKASIPLQNAITSLRNQWESRLDTTEHRVVVELYETIMKSDQPIDETLREFDPDGDGKITCWECKQALGHLKLPDTQCETLMGLMKKHFGNVDSLEIDAWLDYFQELYVNAREADLAHSEKRNMSRFRQLDNELASKKTFVEIFNGLDTDDDGFISENEFSTWIDKSNLKHPLSKKDQHELFRSADVLGHGRLNLFEFMSVMRKIVRVGIQEIGYGYLPLAWASLTAYWAGIGLTELGLSLARLPDTLFMDQSSTISLPHIVASPGVVQLVQAGLVLGALPISIGLTQKLCNDNKTGNLRFGVHAAIQVALAAATLHLMLSPMLMA